MASFALGSGLVTQLGPFHPTKQDYPKFNRKGGEKFGRTGRSGGTCNARTYDLITPSSFPMKFPMPSSVLAHNKYQSVVTIHDIAKSTSGVGRRSLPPGRMQSVRQPVGYATVSTGTQKAGSGFTRTVGIQSQEVELMRELEHDPQLKLQMPQEGSPMDTYQTPDTVGSDPFKDPLDSLSDFESPLPPITGSGSVVIHEEEVSRQSLAAGGYIYVDDSDRQAVDHFNHLQQNYLTHEQEFVDSYNDTEIRASRKRIKGKERASDTVDQYRTRQDIPVNTEITHQFGNGSATEYINQGGGDLVPFDHSSGTLTTTGRYERLNPSSSGDIHTPSAPSLIQQALEFDDRLMIEYDPIDVDMEETEDTVPDEDVYVARSFGPGSTDRSRFTRPKSPTRRGVKRPASAKPKSIRPIKRRTKKSNAVKPQLKRKKPGKVDLIDELRAITEGPVRGKMRMEEERGTKRKNQLEHNVTKRQRVSKKK